MSQLGGLPGGPTGGLPDGPDGGLPGRPDGGLPGGPDGGLPGRPAGRAWVKIKIVFSFEGNPFPYGSIRELATN